MRTIFDPETRRDLIERIGMITEGDQPKWGKMNVYQMLKHCTLWDEMILRNKKYKRSFIGRLFGKMALKSVLKDDSPLRVNTPTIPAFAIKERDGDVVFQKRVWIALINEYAEFSDEGSSFIHPFFGKMTQDQIGRMAFKHTDHHLRQFNR